MIFKIMKQFKLFIPDRDHGIKFICEFPLALSFTIIAPLHKNIQTLYLLFFDFGLSIRF